MKRVALWLAVVLVGCGVALLLAAQNIVVAEDYNGLKETTVNRFSQDSIMFYKPTCESSGSKCSITTSSNLPTETIAQLDAGEVKKKAEENMDRYKYAEEQTGVLWQAVAALHYREAQMRPEASIYNGQNLTNDGSCYTNVDGQQICGDAMEDAKNAASHLVQMAGYFSDHGDPSQPGATLEDYAAAMATYYGGELYQCAGKTYLDSTYVMNGFDQEHMNMSWQDYESNRVANSNYSYCTEKHYNGYAGKKEDNVGALAVFVYLGGAERLSGGGDSCGGSGSLTTGNAIADKAMELSWPVGDPHARTYVGNEAYNEAARRRGGRFVDGCTHVAPENICYSCARFVSMVLLESNADPDFTADTEANGGIPHMLSGDDWGLSSYLKNSPNWEEVAGYDGHGYDLLKPGDILINDPDEHYLDGNGAEFAHTFIYVGNGVQAEGNNSLWGPSQAVWDGDGYRAFRLKGSSNSTTSASSSSSSSSSAGTKSSSDTLTATKDFNAIKNAKNANKQSTDFVKANGENAAMWSDSNTEDMKYLLESYGDLAYQTGRAAGVSWIGILVQMRYEDPSCICGKNNFWGLGCKPGTKAGGATLWGDTLGEGFAVYAEKGLLNGYHDQALGISDPKEFLVKLGPTWVQGSKDGAGYGSIEGMKKSVDALQAFVDSDEGQKIVKSFNGYSVDNSGNDGGSNLCDSSSGGGSSIAGGNGNINDTAIALAQPFHVDSPDRDPYTGGTEAYKKALVEVGIPGLGDNCSDHGNSCDAFVATVMRYSGADPNFYCCGVSDGSMSSYITGSGKYEEVPNDLSYLEPGDIRLSSGHIELYVEVNGEPKIASASHCDRTGEIVDFYAGPNFKAYRLKK